MMPDKTRHVRGLLLYYAYMKGKGGVVYEYMVIERPTQKPIRQKICINRLHMWCINEPGWQKIKVPDMCEKLYGFVTKSGCINIAHVLDEGIEDLHRFPPEQMSTHDQELESMAEQGVIISKNGTPLNA